MLTYEREEHKEEGRREGRVGRLEIWERGKPIDSCLNKV
jgi:hypothetical protein